MTPPTDADQLPPVQYLILELLAARVRTGEQVWSFPDRLRPQLRKLAEAGLIGWKSSPAPGACHAWFLEPGRTLMLLDDFQTPVTRLEKALEELHGSLAEARTALAAVEQDRDRLRVELSRFVRALGGGLMVQHSCGMTFVEPADGSGPGRCAWCAGEQGDVWLPLYVQTPAKSVPPTGSAGEKEKKS